MEQVVQTYNRMGAEKRLPVLRLEIDYELATLHEALTKKDMKKVNECKKKLEEYRLELIRLKA